MSETDPNGVPVPVLPVPALPYSVPTEQRRPGIITAIGVLCITVAALSGLTSLMGGTYSLFFYAMSQVQTRMATAMTSASALSRSQGVPAPPPQSPALPGGDASVAVNAMDSMLLLDNVHLRELDRLMRRHGRQVFGGDDDVPLTSAAVRASVTQSTPLSAGSGKATFSTAQGAVEIYSNRAVFTSANGATTIKTSALQNTDEETTSNSSGSSTTFHVSAYSSAGVGTAPAATTALTDAEIKTIVAAVQRFGTPVNNAQLQTLRAELAKPNQVLSSGSKLSPVVSVQAQPNGNLAIAFDTGNWLVLDRKGAVVFLGFPISNFGVSGALTTVNGLESLASIGLAIYLLIVGIMVLRGSFAAPRLLRIYALIKIPLAIVAGIGFTMLGYAIADASMNSPLTGMSGSSNNSKLGFVIFGVFAVLFGLALPIGLLIALRTRTVRNYYNSVDSSQ